MSDTLLPTVLVDSNVEVNIILREIYYRLQGYYQNAEKLLKDAKKEEHNFSIDNVKKFLHKQILWQRYFPKPKYIPRASYTRLGSAHEEHYLCVCDVASRYRGVYLLYKRSSESVAKAFK